MMRLYTALWHYKCIWAAQIAVNVRKVKHNLCQQNHRRAMMLLQEMLDLQRQRSAGRQDSQEQYHLITLYKPLVECVISDVPRIRQLIHDLLNNVGLSLQLCVADIWQVTICTHRSWPNTLELSEVMYCLSWTQYCTVMNIQFVLQVLKPNRKGYFVNDLVNGGHTGEQSRLVLKVIVKSLGRQDKGLLRCHNTMQLSRWNPAGFHSSGARHVWNPLSNLGMSKWCFACSLYVENC